MNVATPPGWWKAKHAAMLRANAAHTGTRASDGRLLRRVMYQPPRVTARAKPVGK
jgi:hypothetical protein